MIYIIECITPGVPDSDDILSAGIIRTMVGPFDDFDEAHKWMTLNVTTYPTMIIHPLHDPYSLPDSESEPAKDTPGVP